MKEIVISKEFFNIKDTLDCGQIFRYYQHENGYMVFSGEYACFVYENDDKTVIQFDDELQEYFYNFFDLGHDYSVPYNSAINEGVPILTISANMGKGIRILKQNSEEVLFSFIVSQNNHIPRIKKTIEKLCENLGDKKSFKGVNYYTFPTAKKILSKPKEFYSNIGLGYRDTYFVSVANELVNGFNLTSLNSLTTTELKAKLIKLKGVGAKVADCVSLFGFNRFDSFPVDTWIEKLYYEDFKGGEKDRNKMAQYFVNRFGENSGIYQQYLFYYKRSLENKSKTNGK